MATEVFQTGGVVTYQFLCGRELAREDEFAQQMANYCYLVVNTHDRTAIAIDAAWDVEGLYGLAEQMNVRLRGAVYTHFHFDHCGGEVHPMFTGGRNVVLPGAKEVELRGGEVWAGSGDAKMIKRQCSLNAIKELGDGDVIDCGDLVLHFIHTPGHTPGSICVFAAPQCLSPRGALGSTSLQENHITAENGLLITGDTLFVGSCGRTDLPGSDVQQMFSSLSRLSGMHPNVVVCPGHNYSREPFTTVGAERTQNEMMVMGLQRVPRAPPLPPCCVCDSRGACGPRGFIIGRKVKIAGLTSEAGQRLNGRKAVVEAFDTQKERYAVRMLDERAVKSVRADNLDNDLSEGAPAEPRAQL